MLVFCFKFVWWNQHSKNLFKEKNTSMSHQYIYRSIYVDIYIICTYNKHSIIYLRGSLNKFPDFFVWALLLTVHTWNSSPLLSNLLWLQRNCCIIPTTSARPHRSPLVWACQWPLSHPLSSLQLSHNYSHWA